VSTYYVYILSNASRLLYTGITSNLERRVWEHKRKVIPGFTSKYNLHHLVYFETFGDVRAAITREKQIKAWRREKRVTLIRGKNPHWADLASDWFKRRLPRSAKRIVLKTTGAQELPSPRTRGK